MYLHSSLKRKAVPRSKTHKDEFCIIGINVKYGNKLIPRGKNREFKDGIISRGDGFYEDGWITCSWVRNSTTIIGKSFVNSVLNIHYGF